MVIEAILQQFRFLEIALFRKFYIQRSCTRAIDSAFDPVPTHPTITIAHVSL
jgi:hypothetical protein